MPRRLVIPLPILAAAWLACATPPPPLDVAAGYQMFARRDCTRVHAHVQSAYPAYAPTRRERWPWRERLRLLDAYCLELEGNTIAAKEIYSAIVAVNPGSGAAEEASFRHVDIERLEREGVTREERKHRRFGAKSQYEHGAALQPTAPRIAPSYPAIAKAAGIQGWVLVDFEIQSDGTVTDAFVVDSDPPFVFDVAMLGAVRQWTFEASANRERLRRKAKLSFELDRSRFSDTSCARPCCARGACGGTSP